MKEKELIQKMWQLRGLLYEVTHELERRENTKIKKEEGLIKNE